MVDTNASKIKLSDELRVIKKVYAVADRLIIVMDRDIASRFNIDENTLLELCANGTSIIMKVITKTINRDNCKDVNMLEG